MRTVSALRQSRRRWVEVHADWRLHAGNSSTAFMPTPIVALLSGAGRRPPQPLADSHVVHDPRQAHWNELAGQPVIEEPNSRAAPAGILLAFLGVGPVHDHRYCAARHLLKHL